MRYCPKCKKEFHSEWLIGCPFCWTPLYTVKDDKKEVKKHDA